MKKIFIILLLLWCSSIFAQVRISFRNNTGERLEDFMIGTLNVGNIEIDSVYVLEAPQAAFNYFPLLSFSGLYKGKKLTWDNPVICGNGIRTVNEGTFNYSITIRRNYKGDDCFKLSKI